jgi:hypothetical protein
MSWIQLYNSELYDFDTVAPDVGGISIETIAHSLAYQCRFNGHSLRYYSVAEHSILVAERVKELTRDNKGAVLYALMHDASEAILCDIPKPLKLLPSSHWYRELEEEIQEALVKHFVGKYTTMTVDTTKLADFELLSTEAKQLMTRPPRSWGYLPDPLKITLECMSPDEAKEEFINYYNHIKDAT